MVNTSIYIDGEHWAIGLRDLVEHLTDAGVPKRADIDFEKISSWWPATSVDEVILSDTTEELVTDILSIKALPEKIYLLKVFSEGNLLAGFERLRGALPSTPAFYSHGDYTLTFASQSDLATESRNSPSRQPMPSIPESSWPPATRKPVLLPTLPATS